IKVSDVNGNLTEKVWELVVNDEFGLKVYGNYPNPFKDFTIFSYFISSFVPDEFEIRIYTISGKLIKRIENDLNTINDSRGFGAKNVGYNELQWDGTDQNGVRVANGVYFALIYAKYQDKVKQEILKVAKLE
ncbi:MAG: T9SS type A sorting domain-containing protein, partial [Calditrichia bacterium]